jgi:hypothetical protein
MGATMAGFARAGAGTDGELIRACHRFADKELDACAPLLAMTLAHDLLDTVRAFAPACGRRRKLVGRACRAAASLDPDTA